MIRIRLRYRIGPQKFDLEVEDDNRQEAVEVVRAIFRDPLSSSGTTTESLLSITKTTEDILSVAKYCAEHGQTMQDWAADIKSVYRDPGNVRFGVDHARPGEDFTPERCPQTIKSFGRCVLNSGHPKPCVFKDDPELMRQYDESDPSTERCPPLHDDLQCVLDKGHDGFHMAGSSPSSPMWADGVPMKNRDIDTAPVLDPTKGMPTFADHPELFGGATEEPEEDTMEKAED